MCMHPSGFFYEICFRKCSANCGEDRHQIVLHYYQSPQCGGKITINLLRSISRDVPATICFLMLSIKRRLERFPYVECCGNTQEHS